ncbi:MAG: Tim44/TimA family putative adaptor protein [Alphaproteobacteria bacterium]|nr:Tim44/TimA family putative adaptor protein [Alphaproteobacteria bacterium]
MSSSALVEIVFLAAVAAFIAYKLYGVLGRRTGNERTPFDPMRRERIDARGAQPGDEKVVQLPPRPRELARAPVVDSIESKLPVGSPVAKGIADLRQVDRDFSADGFLSGAKVAHEMIAKAFADGDRRALKPLLSDDVYRGFDDAITAREKAGSKVEFSFVGLKQATLEDVTLRGRLAEITVRFVSELISATRDAAGAVIEGAAGAVREVTDVWTFARDPRSSDPNWKLVATASA